MKKTIAVVGASGFVGQALVQKLASDRSLNIIGVCRKPLPDHLSKLKNVSWRKCDLHNLLQAEKSLEGVNCAFYLIHSMTEAVRFREGCFQDVDLSLADHFGRSVKLNDISTVVYLSGLIPPKRTLSMHLASRLEVEDIIKYYHPKTVVVRAGIIFGNRGSSSNILVKLVKRFPILPCPVTVNNICQPIYIDEAISCLINAMDDSSLEGQSVDIGGPDRFSYRRIMEKILGKLDLKRRFYIVPFAFPDFTKKILSWITGSPSGLVYPLFDSMKEQMICRKHFHYRKDQCVTSVVEAIEKSMQVGTSSTYPYSQESKKPTRNKVVRSVQRIHLNPNLNAMEIANYYLHFLSTALIWCVRIESRHHKVNFRSALFGTNLLEFDFSESRSSKDRSLFFIKGGLLVHKGADVGRLEFRQVPNTGATLVCIHDYEPRLPWILYRFTQSIAHTWIIRIFEAWLNAKAIEEDLEHNPKPFVVLRSSETMA